MILIMTMDGNSMVRKELLIFFSTFVARYKARFIVAAFEQLSEDHANMDTKQSDDKSTEMLYMKTRSGATDGASESTSCSQNTIYSAIWKELLVMSVDPHPEIAKDAGIVVDCILIALIESSLGKFVQPQLDEALQHAPAPRPTRRAPAVAGTARLGLPRGPSQRPSASFCSAMTCSSVKACMNWPSPPTLLA